MGKSDFFFVAGLPKAGTTALVSWMIDALSLPRVLKEPGFLYNCPDSVSCFRDDRLSKRRVKFGSLPCDLKQVLDGSPHYLHASHFPKFEEAIHRLRSDEHMVKVVVVLKDPIDRAISHFNHHKRDDAEPLEIREALMPSGYAKRLSETPELWTGYDYLGDSKFAESVHALRQKLSQDELFITSAPLLFENENEAERLANFLGLRFEDTAGFKHVNASGVARSFFGRIVMRGIQLSAGIAAKLITSPAITERLKALKQWALSFVRLEKPQDSGLSDDLTESLKILFEPEYELLNEIVAESKMIDLAKNSVSL